uniref:jhy protein homolog n=1 Tax=Euleptes europaea TaxID=460621 RepID=UPI00253FBD12|nr:jhy protein homolog [Euleptes europaea]
MDESCPSQNGLTQPHVHYSFLKTASEGLLLSEEDFHSSACDSLESDSESLAEEKQYQLELQQRIHNSEAQLSQSYYELEQDSLEEDSLEEKPLSEPEESDVEEAQIPTGTTCGKEDHSNNSSSKEEITDRYSELRYNPNWKNEGEGSVVELKKSHSQDAQGSPFASLDMACSPSQDRLTPMDHHLEGGREDTSSISDSEPLSSCATPAIVSNRSHPSAKIGEQEGKAATACQDSSSSSVHSGFSAQMKYLKRQSSKKDFIGKNKVTLGLAAQQNNSYLRLHSKKQREGLPGQAHQCKGPEMTGAAGSSQGPSLKESSIQYPIGAQVELRGQHGGHHNELEFENNPTNSNSSRDIPNLEQDGRSLLHCRLYPNPPVALLWPSVATRTQDIHFHAGPIYVVHQDGKETSMNLTFARDPPLLSSYPNVPEFHLPCTSENKKDQQNPENPSGYQQRSPRSCAISEPHSLPRHGKHQNPLGHQKISSAYDPGLRQPVNKGFSSCNSRNIYSEDIRSSYVSGNPGPPQSPTHHLTGPPSPTEWLIQAAERHHREISQLADDHLAAMLPPVIQRRGSDSRLNAESSRECQPFLSRSNSEGYLLHMEKQNEKKEKENRKVSRMKGYIKMDVKLGGLGPDYETMKEKAEKIKQQKEYAKQIKEHNMKNIISAGRPPPRPENKLVVSRQKALEYAKKIPKPKIVLSKPEQEPKDEKMLARTLNGENLPPISSLESLQNRHEREKQVVAAFKTLHIV